MEVLTHSNGDPSLSAQWIFDRSNLLWYVLRWIIRWKDFKFGYKIRSGLCRALLFASCSVSAGLLK
uniref:Uncharacterized protein n=1 Tax=Hyaloperonospora arabidopsidis (strain Emoy2) TaxID=559515 RepID=M4BFY7_HYAAE